MTRLANKARSLLALMALAALGVSCDTASPSQPTPHGTTAEARFSGPTTPADPLAPGGSSNGRACAAFAGEPADGQITRYEARERSAWWVTYGIVTNQCHGLVRVTAISPAAPLEQGIDWIGRAMIRPAPSGDAAIVAFWPTRLPPGSWTSAIDAQVQDQGRIQVVALVRMARSTPRNRQPRPVPRVVVTYLDSAGATGQLTLDPGVGFCDCPLPANP